ncbi:hypothetical protein [Nocardia thraciensis]
MVVNDDYDLMVEATVYLAGLRARDCSPSTERAYASRIALYLSYCITTGLDWAAPTVWQLGIFLRWLVEQPLPPRGKRLPVEPSFRVQGTANAIVTTVREFLRFGSLQSWFAPEVVAPLSETKFLAFLPDGFDPGENGQFRTVRAPLIKFRVAVPGYEWLTSEQVAVLIGLAPRARDRFLIALLGCTGMRIGEALGLRRQDMHLLSDSRGLGCAAEGPHVQHTARHPHPNRRVGTGSACATTPSAFPRLRHLEDRARTRAGSTPTHDDRGRAAGHDDDALGDRTTDDGNKDVIDGESQPKSRSDSAASLSHSSTSTMQPSHNTGYGRRCPRVCTTPSPSRSSVPHLAQDVSNRFLTTTPSVQQSPTTR